VISPDEPSRVAGRHHDFYLTAGIFAAGCLLLFMMQWAGGAWTAEFDGHPDEAAQFVSGRVLWEYLRDRPKGNAIEWAEQYYLHYPKVAIGHWPPGYPIIEAAWSLVFGSSRASAMGLQWLIGVAAVGGLYRLIRRRFSMPWTCGVLLTAIATPTFQRSLSLAMADLACLLASVLFMHAMMRLMKNPDSSSILLVAVSLFAAAMIKGTAVCLFPVPVLVLFACRARIPLRDGWAIAGGLILLAFCAVWYAMTTNVIYWGGITAAMPWPIRSLGGLTGWGLIALAALGLRREPLSILCASMVACAVGISFVVRAMNDPRHWIIVLPAILILDAYALTSIPRRYLALVLVAAFALFPYAWYRQTPRGYRDLLRQLRLPARILISGSSRDEGACIAETAIAERYPGSMIVRASKTLANMDSNGDYYQLIATSPEEVSRRLDELAIDIVIVTTARPRRPDQELLIAILSTPAWRFSASAGSLSAYFRTKPPAVPRKPLTVNAGGLHLVERIAGSQ
jgi:hypothetical protein